MPLSNEGTISLSGNLQRGNPNSVSITERERLGSPLPNNRRGGWALQCQNNRRSLLSISRPMNPDPINLKRILSTNNCRLANRQLSSRDGTYVYQCHANLTLSITFNLIQYHNLNLYPYHTFLQFPSISQIPTMQLLSSTLLSTSLTECYLNLSHHNQNKHQPG